MSSRFPVKFCHHHAFAATSQKSAKPSFLGNATPLSHLFTSLDNLSPYPSNHDTTTLYNYLCKFVVYEKRPKESSEGVLFVTATIGERLRVVVECFLTMSVLLLFRAATETGASRNTKLLPIVLQKCFLGAKLYPIAQTRTRSKSW